MSHRCRAIAIRVALGAQGSEVKRAFARYALTFGATGAMVGVVNAAPLNPLMSSGSGCYRRAGVQRTKPSQVAWPIAWA